MSLWLSFSRGQVTLPCHARLEVAHFWAWGGSWLSRSSSYSLPLPLCFSSLSHRRTHDCPSLPHPSPVCPSESSEPLQLEVW